jgi:pimeloyl-ACP methyl ester carboxylesterase
MGRVPTYMSLFDRLRDSGDVILLDQRGVGLSSPSLTCPAASLPPTVFETRASAVAALKGNTAACIARWESKDVKVAAFNTAASADDVEDLRRALGIEQLRLLAFSYGTHVALSALRRHPDGFSQVVLAGTRGPDHSLKLPTTFDLIFEQLSDLAPASRIAGRTLPALTEVVRRQLEALEQKPIVVTITDRREKRPVTLTIGKQPLQTLITNAIGDLRLPAILYSLSAGDTSLFRVLVESVYNGLGAESNLMGRAIDCASGASSHRLERVRREASWALLGDPADNLVRSPEFCDVFQDIDLGEEFRRPVRSSVPTLFISGSLDAKAPAFEAEELRLGFPNSTHVIVQNGFHENLPIAEVQRLVADFFSGRSVADQRVQLPPPQFPTIEAAKTAR